MKKLLLLLSSALLLNGCQNTAPQDSALVYMNNGAVQCEYQGKTGAETAQLLTDKNIVVNETLCGHLSNVFVITVCGAKTANINLHRIAKTDLQDAKVLGFETAISLQNAEGLGYEVTECQ